MKQRELYSTLIRYSAWAASAFILHQYFDFSWLIAIGLGFIFGVVFMMLSIIVFDHLSSANKTQDTLNNDLDNDK